MNDSSTILQHGHWLARHEQNLDSLRFCYDTYLNFMHFGRKPTEFMNATKAEFQLRDAVCRVLGLPQPDEILESESLLPDR